MQYTANLRSTMATVERFMLTSAALSCKLLKKDPTQSMNHSVSQCVCVCMCVFVFFLFVHLLVCLLRFDKWLQGRVLTAMTQKNVCAHHISSSSRSNITVTKNQKKLSAVL